jgi:DNA invertase Pin-like site-specific DNA recombinase
LRRLLAEIRLGDVVMVMRLARLTRSIRDLLNTLAAITGKEAGFRSLFDGLHLGRQRNGELECQ